MPSAERYRLYREDPEKYYQVRKEASERWRQKNPVDRMLDSSKQRAKKAGIEWSLTKDDIVVPDVCPFLNKPFKYDTPYAASLDRIDNSKGYIPGNVQVVSRLANTMKSSASSVDLLSFAREILKRYATQ